MMWWWYVALAGAVVATPAPAVVATPAPNCVSMRGDELLFECQLESKLTIRAKVNEYMKVLCHGTNITCASLPQLDIGGGRALSSVELERCPGGLAGCMLAAAGARGARELWLTRPAGPLAPGDAAQLQGLRTLAYFDAASLHELSAPVLSELLELTVLRVTGGSLSLSPELFARAGLSQLEYLLLGRDNITSLPDGAFRGLPALTKLLLYSNPVRHVGEHAFDGLPSLEQLCLNSNELSSLPRGVLAPLPALRAVRAEGNRFTSLQQGIFTGPRLENITLFDNEANLTIESGAFSDLPSLALLDVSRSRLTSIAPDFLANSTRLRSLNLADNYLAELQPGTLDNLPVLRELNLSNNRLMMISASLFRGLEGLETLNLDGNRIETLPDYLFAGLKHLGSVSMNHNNVHTIAPLAFHGAHLTSLSLAHNELALVPAASYESGAPSPFNPLVRLRELRLADNRLAGVAPDWTDSMPRLRALDLAGNRFTHLHWPETHFVAEGVTVDLRRNRISVVMLETSPPAATPRPPDTLQNTFLLDDNPFDCGCQLTTLKQVMLGDAAIFTWSDIVTTPVRFDLGQAQCASPPRLKGRLVKNITPEDIYCDSLPEDCPTNCNCTERSYTRIIELACPDLPQLWPETISRAHDAKINIHVKLTRANFTHLPSFIDRLDLSDADVQAVTFAATPTLRALDLSNNSLTSIPVALLRPNLSLSLSHNPLECSCSNQLDVQTLKQIQNEYSTISDYYNVTCGNNMNISDIYADTLCHTKNAAIAAALTVCVLLTASVVTAIVIYYYFNELLVFIVNNGYCGCLFSAEFVDADKAYDAFISFSHHDDKFVSDELIPKLENDFKQKLCVHYRDWVVGDLIPMQIVNSVANSRKTIIVLSENFLSSTWAALEFREAHNLALRDGRARVVLIILDENVLNHEKMSDELRAYITTNTYIKANDPRFYERLSKALPARSREFTLLNKLKRRGKATRPATGGLDVQLNSAGQLVNAAGGKPDKV